MNIDITSIFLNKNKDIEFSYSVNDRNEQDETMNKDDFAKLLCEHSDGNDEYSDGNDIIDEKGIYYDHYITEDKTKRRFIKTNHFNEYSLNNNIDYCKDCLNNHIQSLNKNL